MFWQNGAREPKERLKRHAPPSPLRNREPPITNSGSAKHGRRSLKISKYVGNKPSTRVRLPLPMPARGPMRKSRLPGRALLRKRPGRKPGSRPKLRVWPAKLSELCWSLPWRNREREAPVTDRWLKAAIYSSVLVLIAQLFAAWAHAQNSTAASPGKNTAQEERVSAQSGDFGNQLARESREAAGEETGENDELKKSPAVQFVARLTGMSLQHAYWLCMLLNFALIAAAILWLSRLHLPGLFRSRTESIQSAMNEAGQAADDANR